MICEYCHSEGQTEARCNKCGAPTRVEVKRGTPFLYTGYIVWLGRDYSRDTYEASFFLGERLVQTISVPHRNLRDFVPEGCDSMDFFYKLLTVAIGEVEVLRVKEMNTKNPATFEIRRIENLDYETTKQQLNYIFQDSRP